MSRLFDQKIIAHSKVDYVSNEQGVRGDILTGDLVELQDGSKWINVLWRPTAGGIEWIFENVDNLEKVNGLYDFTKQKWDNGARISIDRKRFLSKLEKMMIQN